MKDTIGNTTVLDEERQRKVTAFHEAAHAIVGHLLGFPIYSITIVAIGDLHGHTTMRRKSVVSGVVDWDIAKGITDDSPLADQLTYLYAGIVGERLLLSERGIGSNLPEEEQDDMHLARCAVQHLSEEEQVELLDLAEKRARAILSDPQNRQTLEQIVAKILEFKTLEGSLLSELLDLTKNPVE